MGLGQRSRSNFWRAAVDIRGSALPSAAKRNKSHDRSKMFVCVCCNQGAYADNSVDAVDQLLIVIKCQVDGSIPQHHWYRIMSLSIDVYAR